MHDEYIRLLGRDDWSKSKVNGEVGSISKGAHIDIGGRLHIIFVLALECSFWVGNSGSQYWPWESLTLISTPILIVISRFDTLLLRCNVELI